MKIIITLFTAFLLLGFQLVAQEGPYIKFEKTHHDFGKVKEDGGSVSYTFKVTNTGNKPLSISRVQASCGCTSPDWTKEEIKPGKEGFVKATFDPYARPGNFTKSLTIYSNASPNMALLTFGGEVIPRVKTMEDSFPAAHGNLRFVINHINFGSVKNNVKDTVAYLTLLNTWTKPMTIKSIKGPAYITSKIPFTLYPRKETKYPFHYDATQVKDYGLMFDQMKLVTDDEKDPEKPISIIADIHQYVTPLNDKEMEKAPKIAIDRNEHNFGNMKQGDNGSTIFKVKNVGKQILSLYKVKTSCGCTATEMDKKQLKPGEESDLRVTFSSAGKNGAEEKTITIYCNDPITPEVTLRIKANVIVEPKK